MSTLVHQASDHLEKMSLEDRVAGLELALAGQGLRPLIQQVAWVLFFEYEKLPTGNNIYALLKQGSMTTYGSEVNVFWDNVREQVKEVQALANIPEPLAREISRSISGIWRLAQNIASENLTRPSKAREPTLEILTPLSRISARMNAIKSERDALLTQLSSFERLRDEHDALKKQMTKKDAEHAKIESELLKQKKKLQKDLTQARAKDDFVANTSVERLLPSADKPE